MRKLLFLLSLLLFCRAVAFADGPIPIGATYQVLFETYDCTTCDDDFVLTNADSTPSCQVYVAGSSTPAYTANATNITTGKYRFSFVVSVANGFAANNHYQVSCTATVDMNTGVADKGSFYVLATGMDIYPRGITLNNKMFKMQTSAGADCTGKTITRSRSLDGAAFATGTLGSASEVSAGWYKLNIPAADMTADEIVLRFEASGCRTTEYILHTQH